MPELPWVKWYPTNWASEPGLRLCRPSTRGIWFDALNTMMLSQTYQISGTNQELCSLLSCIPAELTMAIEQLKKHKVGEINEQNGNINLISRRLKRDCDISQLRSKAGKASGTKRRTNSQHGVRTPSASSSASAFASERSLSENPSWDEFWEYCISPHCGIAAEWYAKEKYWAACQDNWKGKANWRAYANRVRTWWEQDGRPMTPPQKNGQKKPVRRELKDATYDASQEQ